MSPQTPYLQSITTINSCFKGMFFERNSMNAFIFVEIGHFHVFLAISEKIFRSLGVIILYIQKKFQESSSMSQNSGEIIQSDCSFDNKILLPGLRVRHRNFGDIDTSRWCNFKRQTSKTS